MKPLPIESAAAFWFSGHLQLGRRHRMSEPKQFEADRPAGSGRSRWVLAFNVLMIILFCGLVLGSCYPG